MIILSNLSDEDLLANTRSLAEAERVVTERVIDLLREIDRRGLSTEIGYSNLFEEYEDEAEIADAQTSLFAADSGLG